jgi:uncharacterized protein YndB with AHSA1/START domain
MNATTNQAHLKGTTMPTTVHRLSIEATPERVRELAGTTEGIQRWWTGHPLAGDDQTGGRFSISFGDAAEPAATFEVLDRGPEQIGWRCVGGPNEWTDARITFGLTSRDGGTAMLFSHRDWRQESEFMHGCSTNWAAYLMNLKSGAEDHRFDPHPGGEIGRGS